VKVEEEEEEEVEFGKNNNTYEARKCCAFGKHL
jgi:hypothetical protein